MDLNEFFADKSLKAKEKTELLGSYLSEHPSFLKNLLDFAKTAKDPVKGTCVEAVEYVTKTKASIADKACLDFMSENLLEKAPRVKWESAKVIGNIAHLFPNDLDEAIVNLLVNSEHEGTVVRWSAAYALGEIVKLKTKHNMELIPALESISRNEEKNSIKKVYLDAMKKASK